MATPGESRPTDGTSSPTAPASAAPPDARSPRRPSQLAVGAIAAVAVVAVLGSVVLLRAGDEDRVASSGTSLAWEEAWRTPLRDLGFDVDVDDAGAATAVWADADVAAIVVSGEDGEDDEDVAALVVLDPVSGEVRWTTDVVARFGFPTVFRSGDVLVVVSDTGDGSFGSREARAFDVGSGDRVWRERDAGVLVVPVGDLIVINRQHHPSEDVVADLLVVDAATGDTVFERAPQKGLVSVRTVRADGLVVVESTAEGSRLIGLSLDGDERWSRPVQFGLDTATDVHLDRNGGTTVVVDDDEMLGLDVDTGDERWSVAVEPDDDSLVVPSPANDAVLLCIEVDDGLEIRVHDLESGSERWDRTFEGDEAGLLGVSGSDVVLGEVPIGDGCSLSVAPYASSLEVLAIASGERTWRVTDDDSVGVVELRWAGLQEQLAAGVPAFLTSVLDGRRDDQPEVSELIDPVTGETILTTRDEENWQYTVIAVVDGAPVGFALDDDEVIVFDPADHTRRIVTGRGRLLGVGGGVLYVLDGDTVLAVR